MGPTRTSILTAVAAGLFATAVLVGPRLLTAGVDAGGSQSVFAAGGDASALELSAGTTLDAAIAAAPPEPGSVFSPRHQPLPSAARLDGDPGGAGRDAGDPVPEGGLISVSVEPLDRGPFHHDDEVRLQITVRNIGGEYLWGVYAYLEDYGRVDCSDRRLAPGDTSECIARVRLGTDDFTADAWATAWTETEEIWAGDVSVVPVGA